MSKVIFIGDSHFTGISPSSRKETNEQYRQVQIEKLDSIKNICLNKNIEHVIFLGDVFNNNSGLTNYFETEIWAKLLEFKNNNIKLHTIIGNHDMAFQNETEFKGTYLYKAFLAGIINYLTTLDLGDVHIVGVDYNKEYKQVDYASLYNILVAHSFYENERFGGTGNSNLTDEKCRNLGYMAYVLGHDHSPYPEVVVSTPLSPYGPEYKVFRPGSLTRGTSKTCNLYRKVQAYVFDSNTKEWSLEEIPTKPGLEVFKEKVVMQKDIDLNLQDILQNLDYSKDSNIYDIISKNEASGREKLGPKYDSVVNLITQYCESVGIYNTKGV